MSKKKLILIYHWSNLYLLFPDDIFFQPRSSTFLLQSYKEFALILQKINSFSLKGMYSHWQFVVIEWIQVNIY